MSQHNNTPSVPWDVAEGAIRAYAKHNYGAEQAIAVVRTARKEQDARLAELEAALMGVVVDCSCEFKDCIHCDEGRRVLGLDSHNQPLVRTARQIQADEARRDGRNSQRLTLNELQLLRVILRAVGVPQRTIEI